MQEQKHIIILLITLGIDLQRGEDIVLHEYSKAQVFDIYLSHFKLNGLDNILLWNLTDCPHYLINNYTLHCYSCVGTTTSISSPLKIVCASGVYHGVCNAQVLGELYSGGKFLHMRQKKGSPWYFGRNWVLDVSLITKKNSLGLGWSPDFSSSILNLWISIPDVICTKTLTSYNMLVSIVSISSIFSTDPLAELLFWTGFLISCWMFSSMTFFNMALWTLTHHCHTIRSNFIFLAT